MRLSIEPIGPQFRESLKELLGPFGLPPDIVEWKYFQRPRTDALTGLVWVKDGRVRGAVGLIPFRLKIGNTRVPASWTCDWVVDSPQSNPGIGVLILQRAKELAGPLFSLGGNELNRQLMPRIATSTVEKAAVELYLPLRVGGSRWFRGIDRRTGGAVRLLGRLPARGSGRVRGTAVVPGVSPLLEPLLESASSDNAIPTYTLEHVRWQLERAPGVECVTVHSGLTDLRAAGVCWSRAAAPADWRAALWGVADDVSQSEDVLRAAIAHVSARGAHRLSIMVSRLDTDRLALLESLGFMQEGSDRALYITSAAADLARPLAGLSFLDTDLAYRI